MEMDQFFSAIEAAERATKISPKWPDGFLTLARAQINFGELEIALETLKYAITLPVTDKDVKESIGAEFQRAMELLEQRNKLEETSFGGRVVRGHFISKEECMRLVPRQLTLCFRQSHIHCSFSQWKFFESPRRESQTRSRRCYPSKKV
jgi:tetratricopeptide (TPR) repeat protein